MGRQPGIDLPTPQARRQTAAEAIDSWRKYRKAHNITLGPGLTIRQLIEEGRR